MRKITLFKGKSKEITLDAKKLIAVFAVFVIIILIVVITIFTGTGKNTPEKIAKEFVEANITGDLESAIQYLPYDPLEVAYMYAVKENIAERIDLYYGSIENWYYDSLQDESVAIQDKIENAKNENVQFDCNVVSIKDIKIYQFEYEIDRFIENSQKRRREDQMFFTAYSFRNFIALYNVDKIKEVEYEFTIKFDANSQGDKYTDKFYLVHYISRDEWKVISLFDFGSLDGILFGQIIDAVMF